MNFYQHSMLRSIFQVNYTLQSYLLTSYCKFAHFLCDIFRQHITLKPVSYISFLSVFEVP